MDQDALNVVFQNDNQKLPAKFNRSVWHLRAGGAREIERLIYHYSGQPYVLNSKDEFDRLYFSHFAKTPFFDSQTILGLFDGYRQIIDAWKAFSIKQRGFFIYHRDLNNITKIFGRKPDDIFINAAVSNSVGNLLQVMNQMKGQRVFGIIIADKDYPKVRDFLMQKGFKERVDFFNAMTLMYPEKNIVPKM